MHGISNPGILGSIVSLFAGVSVRSPLGRRDVPINRGSPESRRVLARKETYFAQTRFTWWKQ